MGERKAQRRKRRGGGGVLMVRSRWPIGRRSDGRRCWADAACRRRRPDPRRPLHPRSAPRLLRYGNDDLRPFKLLCVKTPDG